MEEAEASPPSLQAQPQEAGSPYGEWFFFRNENSFAVMSQSWLFEGKDDRRTRDNPDRVYTLPRAITPVRNWVMARSK